SMAEKDMAIIRSKRGNLNGSSSASNNGGNGTGEGDSPNAQKAKYRKRSRASPPGKCHSCNIRETPEWRRGPDGARTLCNACGLHYAKLMRKRDKAAAAEGTSSGPPIDIEMLRASTRVASSTHPNPPSNPSNPSNANPSNEDSKHYDRGNGGNGGGAGEMAEIQLMPVHQAPRGLPPVSSATTGSAAGGTGGGIQVHQWSPPGVSGGVGGGYGMMRVGVVGKGE
ncbi:hypothetical protein M422DRAFT_156680, partial [Sphaerobolus stellatus SS14]